MARTRPDVATEELLDWIWSGIRADLSVRDIAPFHGAVVNTRHHVGVRIALADESAAAWIDVRDLEVDASGKIVSASLLVFQEAPGANRARGRLHHVGGTGAVRDDSLSQGSFREHDPEATDPNEPRLAGLVFDALST